VTGENCWTKLKCFIRIHAAFFRHILHASMNTTTRTIANLARTGLLTCAPLRDNMSRMTLSYLPPVIRLSNTHRTSSKGPIQKRNYSQSSNEGSQHKQKPPPADKGVPWWMDVSYVCSSPGASVFP